MISHIQNFFNQLKERGVRKTLTIYISSALTTVGVVKLFSEVYNFSPVIFPVVVTILTFGLASAFVFAWTHGKEGTQKFQPKEIVFHSLVLAIALFVSFRIGGTPQTSLQFVDNDVPSVAILYLKNLGSEADEPYSYGITQDLIVDIAKAGLIRVAPMKDIMSVQSSTMPVDSIALKLRVRYVLDGSIKRIGDMLQLSGQIVEAATGTTIWADRLQTKVGEAARLQGQLAQAIINALHLTPSDVIKKNITKVRTTNPEAYEFYLRAKYLFEKKKTKEDIITARGMYQKAIDLDGAFVPAHLGRGQTYESQGEYKQAEQIYKRSLEIAQQFNEQNEEASSLSRIGVIEWHQGNYPKALEYLARSLNVSYEMGDRASEGKTLGNIGNVYNLLGDYSKALDYYTKTLKTVQELGDHKAEGYSLNNTGLVYWSVGDYGKALDFYTKSLKIKQELGDRLAEGITLNNIGAVYYEQGNYSKTLDYQSQSLKIVQELGDQVGEGYALSAIGAVYYSQANYDKAIEFLKKSETIFAQIDEKPERMSALSWLAVTEARIENRRNAQANVDSVEKLFGVVPKPEEYIRICWNLYHANLLLGNSQKASHYLERAYQEITSRAERISDKTMRQSYLTNVKTNREVIIAWKGMVNDRN